MNITVNTDPSGILRGIQCFALDMDGTIYLGNQWIPGAQEFLRALDEYGKQYVFMTNNSSKSAQAYYHKLEKMGFPIRQNQLVTSAHATIYYLKRQFPGKGIFLLGNPSIREEFLQSGIRLEECHPEVVVTAFDTTFDYKKMCTVCNFVREGMPYIATHPDYNCPTETGYIPDIGAIHAFIEASTGRQPDKIIGKPNREIIEYMLNLNSWTPDNTAVIGDRLYTDVASGVNNGLTGILVLSGETSMCDLPASKTQPHLVFNSLQEITPLLYV